MRQGLSFESVSAGYPGRMVIENLSFMLEPGTLAGIMGPNGCGKTTLLKTAAGLMPPASGRVLAGGSPIQELGPRGRAERLSYCPQDASASFPFPVREVVMFGRFPRLGAWGAASASDQDAVRRALDATGTAHLSERPVDELSGGELRRVMLARTIAQEAAIMLLDEPTSGLDVGSQAVVMRALKSLSSSGRLVVAAMHDLNEASAWCDTILLFSSRRLVASGPPKSVLNAESIRSAFDVRVESHEAGGRISHVPAAAE
jgi:iron complex transport system ATP-binding protein